MASISGKMKTWLAILGTTVGLAAFISFRVYYLRSHGQNVFWLAELFSPAALFCVVVVTFVDKLVGPASKAKLSRGKKAR